MTTSIAAWIADLQGGDVQRAAEAAEQLCHAGETARAGAVALAIATGHADESVREWATAALEQLGPPPEDALEPLVSLLSESGEPASDRAYWAAALLERLGGDAAAAVPSLVATLEGHPTLAVREVAARALGEIGVTTPAVVAALQQAQAAPHPRLARVAGWSLDKLGS